MALEHVEISRSVCTQCADEMAGSWTHNCRPGWGHHEISGVQSRAACSRTPWPPAVLDFFILPIAFWRSNWWMGRMKSSEGLRGRNRDQVVQWVLVSNRKSSCADEVPLTVDQSELHFNNKQTAHVQHFYQLLNTRFFYLRLQHRVRSTCLSERGRSLAHIAGQRPDTSPSGHFLKILQFPWRHP